MRKPIPDAIAAGIRKNQARGEAIANEIIGMVKAAALIYGIQGPVTYDPDTMTLEVPDEPAQTE